MLFRMIAQLVYVSSVFVVSRVHRDTQCGGQAFTPVASAATIYPD